jgi:Phosphotransferase enzyme family
VNAPGAPARTGAPTTVPGPVAAMLGGAAPADDAFAFTRLTHSELTGATGGVWRVSGPGGSAVLKLCAPGRPENTGPPSARDVPATRPDPRHWNHWRREPLAYRDGLASTAFSAAGIDSPRPLAADERPDGSFALWLEDVSGVAGSRWPVSRLAAFGQALGAAQAPWIDRLPDESWLSRRWLRQYVASKSLPARIPWDHPTAVAVWPGTLRAGLRRIWEQREILLTVAESGPRTLCHLDVWPLNLLAADTGGTDRTVLLDWAFVGEGGVGEDIANLIPDCVADGLMPTELLPEIADTVTRGYLAGLRDAGHRVDADHLRRTVAAAGAAKYSWLAPLMLTRLAAGTPVGSASYDVGGDDLAVLRRRIGLFEHLVAWSEYVLGP